MTEFKIGQAVRVRSDLAASTMVAALSGVLSPYAGVTGTVEEIHGENWRLRNIVIRPNDPSLSRQLCFNRCELAALNSTEN